MTTPTTKQAGPLVAIGGSTLRRTIQSFVGFGLAIFLLWWGLPKVAKTTWTDVWLLDRQPTPRRRRGRRRRHLHAAALVGSATAGSR